MPEVKAILLKPINYYPPPLDTMTELPPVTEPVTAPYRIGTVNPPPCAVNLVSGTELAHRDNGYRGFYQTTMEQPGPKGSQAITQTVAVFDDATSAQDAQIAYMRQFRACHDAASSLPREASSVTDPSGAILDWIFSTPIDNWAPTQRFDPSNGPTNPLDIYTSDHQIIAQDNVLIDITVSGLIVQGRAHTVLRDLVDRVKHAAG